MSLADPLNLVAVAIAAMTVSLFSSGVISAATNLKPAIAWALYICLAFRLASSGGVPQDKVEERVMVVLKEREEALREKHDAEKQSMEQVKVAQDKMNAAVQARVAAEERAAKLVAQAVDEVQRAEEARDAAERAVEEANEIKKKLTEELVATKEKLTQQQPRSPRVLSRSHSSRSWRSPSRKNHIGREIPVSSKSVSSVSASESMSIAPTTVSTSGLDFEFPISEVEEFEC